MLRPRRFLSDQTGLTVRTAPASCEPRERPRILFFAPKECWPPNTGAKLRNYYLARDLSRYADVTYLAFADNQDGRGSRDKAIHDDALGSSDECQGSQFFRKLVGAFGETGAEYEPIDPVDLFHRTVVVDRPSRYKLSNIIRGAIGRTPLTVLNYTTRDMARRLTRLLDQNDFDIVQMESLHLAAYLPLIRAARSQPLVVCDWHNVESELMLRYSQHERRISRKLYARATARRISRLEQRAIGEFDAHLTVSSRDAGQLGRIGSNDRVFVLENGVDILRFSDNSIESAYLAWLTQKGSAQNVLRGTDDSTALNRVLYVGSMDYHANEDAVVHFANEIWPRVSQARPDLTFTIVGRNPTPAVMSLASLPGVEVTGTVDDVRPYYRYAIAAVVPLRVGGGSRLKILEAMAAGVPVVSTSLGAEGLAVESGKNILIAGSAADFARAVVRISADAGVWQRISVAGRHLVRGQYGWEAIGARLKQIHMELLSSRAELSVGSPWALADAKALASAG